MELKRVVVTGLGVITPIGNSVETYWNNLIKGVSGAGPITRFDATNFKTKFACEVKDFDPTDYLDRKEVRKMDLFAQYAMAAAEQAIQDSGLNLEELDPDEAGVIWGAGIGGIITFMDEVKAYVEATAFPVLARFSYQK